MDQQLLQTALAADKAPDAIKAKLGDQFKEGDTLKVTDHNHGTSATWRRPDGQRVTANVQPERPKKTPVASDKKLAGAPENK